MRRLVEPARATVVEAHRVELLLVDDDSTLLVLGPAPASTASVVVPARPDTALARLLCAQLRRVRWAHLRIGEGEMTAEVVGTARLPVRRAVPLAVALGMAEAGVPTFVTQVRR